MSRTKEKQEPYIYEYTRELREIKPVLNQPTKGAWSKGSKHGRKR